MTDEVKRGLLEMLDDRCNRKTALITIQLPVDPGRAYLADSALAGAILGRRVHNSD